MISTCTYPNSGSLESPKPKILSSSSVIGHDRVVWSLLCWQFRISAFDLPVQVHHDIPFILLHPQLLLRVLWKSRFGSFATRLVVVNGAKNRLCEYYCTSTVRVLFVCCVSLWDQSTHSITQSLSIAFNAPSSFEKPH